MDITSGECVNLAKQYTFKTTKATQWMEPILDDLSNGRDRSAVIREMITDHLVKSGIKEKYEEKYGDLPKKESPLARLITWVGNSDTKSHTIKHKETPKVIQRHSKETPSVTLFDTPPPMEEGIEDTEVDLEKKLNSLDF